jgi:AraC-like DNA-binding protein
MRTHPRATPPTEPRFCTIDGLSIRFADRLGLSQRSVQEICHRGLGIHPKWLIRCFRLQDAALRLEAEANVSLSGLAQALGYFDQAHFTRDFKRATA